MFVVGGESLIDLVQERPGAGRRGADDRACGRVALQLRHRARQARQRHRLPLPDQPRRLRHATCCGPSTRRASSRCSSERVVAPTTLAVVTLNAKMEAQYEFYRGADRAFTSDGADRGAARQTSSSSRSAASARSSRSMPRHGSRSLAGSARDAARRSRSIPTCGPSLVDDFAAYKERLDALPRPRASRQGEPRGSRWSLDRDEEHSSSTSPTLLARPNCELVVVTLGDEGSLAFTASGSAKAGIYSPAGVRRHGRRRRQPDGRYPHAPRRSGRPEARQAHARSAIRRSRRCCASAPSLRASTAARKGCNPPTRGEVDAVLAKH